MSLAPPCTTRSSELDLFHTRCRDLQLASWEFDSKGSLTQRPQHNGRAGLWLSSSELQPHIERVAHLWLKSPEPQSAELFPSCWLLPVVDPHPSCQSGIIVVLALGKPAFEQERFEVICQAAALDVQETQRTLEAMARYQSSDLDTLAKILSWSRQDLAKSQLDQQAIDQFSNKLLQSYEEANLLFRLAQHMNCVTEPAEMIEEACKETHSIMPFQWTAVCFNQSSLVIENLAGRLFLTGTLPCDAHLFGATATQFLMHSPIESWTHLLQPNHNAVATLVGSEIIAHPITYNDTVVGSLLVGNKQGHDTEASSIETQFLDAMANLLSVFHQNTSRFNEQREMFLGTLQSLTASVDAKDAYTRGHSERVALLSTELATTMGLPPIQVERIRIAGMVHDVGKIGVPEAVLCKRGRLTVEEFEQMKKHPTIGYNILKDIPPMQDVLPGVLHHHERWDGKGYPHGLSASNIPLFGRILALADTFDAMSSDRSYRAAMDRDKVIEEIRQCRGSQFDTELADLFVSLNFEAYDELILTHKRDADNT